MGTLENQFAGRRYLTSERLYAYVRQFELLGPETRSILEVGTGPGIFAKMARAAGFDYLSLDYAFATRPDLVGDVSRLPLKDKRFDTVFCCQVLEHIPFDRFAASAQELCRLARRKVVISVPDNRKFKRLAVHLPLAKFRKVLSVPRTGLDIDISAHGEHFWEIGGAGFRNCVSVPDVLARLRPLPGLRSVREFRLFERPYQHFFVLELG